MIDALEKEMKIILSTTNGAGLADEFFLERITQYIRGLITIRDGTSVEFLNLLEELLKRNESFFRINLELEKVYLTFITILKFISLPYLDLKEVNDLIQKNLINGLEIDDFDLFERINAFFIIQPYYKENEVKDSFLKSLKSNLEMLGKEDLTDQKGNTFKNNVKGWLIIFQEFLGQNFGDVSKEVEFLNTNSNVKKLDIDQKIKLKHLLRIYDFLQFTEPLQNLQQREETHVLPKSLKPLYEKKEENKETFIKPQAALIFLANQALKEKYQNYQSSEMFVSMINRKEALKKDSTDFLNLKAPFYHALNTKDAPSVIAILLLLGENGYLKKFFSNDKRYIDFFESYLKRSAETTANGRPLSADDFIKDPVNKVYIGSFIKLMLEKRLGLTKDEAAIVGTELATRVYALGQEKEYQDLAYGDEGSGVFVWNF